MADQRFELATITGGAGGAGDEAPVGCLFAGGRYWPLAPLADRLSLAGLGAGTVRALFDDWDTAFAALRQAAAACEDKAADLAVPADRVTLLAPLLYPGKILCAGANYYDHLAEMGMPDAKKADQRPFFFFKPPRQAVVGPGRTVPMPRDSNALDWEIELVGIFGRTATAVPAKDARAHIAAWTVGIDFSARDLNRAPETFYKLDWVAGKGQDGCGPMGPHLVPSAFVPDPMALSMKLSVNGETKQDANSAGMIFNIDEQISALSRIMTMEPGDALFTGTPAGVGAPKQTFLSVGDKVDASIGGLGTLSVEIAPRR